MATSPLKLQPGSPLDTLFGEERRHLIRINGDAIGMVNTEEDAKKMILSMANEEEKKLAKPGRVVFRRYINEGKEIQLYTQTNGRVFKGYLVSEVIIDTLPISQMSPYAKLIAQFKAEKAKKV